MYSAQDTSIEVGFPIRRSSDQGLVDSSPKHFAVSHVLHRQQVPRHPPHALTNFSMLLARLTDLASRCRSTTRSHRRIESRVMKSYVSHNDGRHQRRHHVCVYVAFYSVFKDSTFTPFDVTARVVDLHRPTLWPPNPWGAQSYM